MSTQTVTADGRDEIDPIRYRHTGGGWFRCRDYAGSMLLLGAGWLSCLDRSVAA
jgi:hypothetical protein